jgi:hypothetical protein
MNKFSYSCLVISLLSNVVYAQEFKCPEQIETQQSLNQEKAGFDQYIQEYPHHLSTVGFTEGHPDDLALIKPNAEGPNGEPKYEFFTSRDIWMLCYYDNTKVTLIKNIGKPKTCTQLGNTSQCD